MNRFEWQPEYSVSDDKIDAQHRELIDIINELADQLKKPEASTDEARALFDRLATYVTAHFAYEEDRIAAADYPEALVVAHQAEHNKILRQLQEFEQIFESGDASALEQLMPFLYGDWLIHHICGTDKDYIPYITGAR